MTTNRFIATAAAVLLLAASSSAQVPATRKAAAKTKTQRYVELLAGNDVLKNSVWGILAMTQAGDTIASWNSGLRMMPASNMKLITTGAAMHRLGPDFKFETRLAYSGTVSGGTLDGDLYIIGGGDPTIASKDTIALTRDKLFGLWKGFLDKAGIKRINGRVIGDGRYFDGPIEDASWQYEDIGTYYGTGGDGLCFYENTQDFRVSAGASVGSPVNVLVSFPQTPWMKYSFTGKTSKAGTGDELYLYTSDVCPFAEMRGTFAIDRSAKMEEFANKYGAYTCAHYFCEYLASAGVPVTQGPADVRGGRIRSDLTVLTPGPYAAKVDDLTVVGRTYSPTLKQIVRETNHRSDNFYAETAFRTLGRRMHHSACADSSLLALTEVLRSLGVDPSGVNLKDGSGLSRKNYVSPEYFVRFLTAMMDSPVFEEYVGTLPQPGRGTLASRLRGEKESVKSRIYMKSGSMDGVLCYSGYIVPSEGSKADAIVFSLLTNNVIAPTRDLTPIIDRILASLAAEN